ncbi:MAG TPA: hypothetical protein VK631_07710, partial [Solirubrobacteraceae bacterium]|nr:hypothetical protein [Solirubrobacteraceae bacterium]
MPLHEELLARLERCLSDERFPWLSARRPALSDEDMAQLTEPIGIRLPPELRLWWRWFNGATTPGRVPLTPALEVLSLEVALEARAAMRTIAADVGETRDEDIESLWPFS